MEMMTKDDLKEYLWIKENIDFLEEKLLEIDTQLQRITSITYQDAVQTTKETDRFGNLISKKVEIEKEINNKIVKSYEALKKIERLITNLKGREKLLMRLRYIEGEKWEIICYKMNYEWRHVHNIHSKILRDLNIT